MSDGFSRLDVPANERVLSYAPGTPERDGLQAALRALRTETIDIPLIIGGREVRTGVLEDCRAPHDHGCLLARYHKAGPREVEQAIACAVEAGREWAAMRWEDRAAVFLRAADLLAGPQRLRHNAATMLGQSKNAFQAEIDAACELADFFRFNCHFATRIYAEQPLSPPGQWNRLDYRPVEGFVFAVTPFNFTSIAGNLPSAPAIMGATAVWKPASSAVYSGYHVMRLFQEAGLPDGVINFVPGPGAVVGGAALASPHLGGIHFTGSTGVFQGMWRTVGERIASYRAYPRLVGETGGKDFVVAHVSADPDELVTALVRGAFEYQGQKCSAVSRAYIPRSLWARIRDPLVDTVRGLRMGGVEDFGNFVNAVIDAGAFDAIAGFIAGARGSADAEILCGGGCDRTRGFFIEPTVVLAHRPDYRTMVEEIFGPVLTLCVYDDGQYEETLDLCDRTSPYALTGAVFARDRRAVALARERLVNAAGNFYINDKPTGAVVGQQPFGGARASGTNDKAGSVFNLLRWVSPRAIKETFVPPRDYRYPFMG